MSYFRRETKDEKTVDIKELLLPLLVIILTLAAILLMWWFLPESQKQVWG